MALCTKDLQNNWVRVRNFKTFVERTFCEVLLESTFLERELFLCEYLEHEEPVGLRECETTASSFSGKERYLSKAVFSVLELLAEVVAQASVRGAVETQDLELLLQQVCV
jgi:hypothetical protein